MAVAALLALPAVCTPRLAIEKLSWLLGFGEPPDVPLLRYMMAGGAFVYLAQSALFWMISCDVTRYRPLVIFTGVVCLIGGPAFWWIDTQAGMPHWWMLMDSLGCFAGGLALLLACGTSKP